MTQPPPDKVLTPDALILGSIETDLAVGHMGGYVRMALGTLTEGQLVAGCGDEHEHRNVEREIAKGPVIAIPVQAIPELIRELAEAHDRYIAWAAARRKLEEARADESAKQAAREEAVRQAKARLQG